MEIPIPPGCWPWRSYTCRSVCYVYGISHAAKHNHFGISGEAGAAFVFLRLTLGDGVLLPHMAAGMVTGRVRVSPMADSGTSSPTRPTPTMVPTSCCTSELFGGVQLSAKNSSADLTSRRTP